MGALHQATGWLPSDRRNDALDAQGFSQPAVVGLGIVDAIGQGAREAQPVPGLCHQGAKLHMVPSRPQDSRLLTQYQGIDPDGHRLLQPRAGAVASTRPL
jgi:hypothetical protein